MKITFIQHGYGLKPDGGMKVMYQYANQLVARGHQVTVVHPGRLVNVRHPLARLYLWLTGKMTTCASSMIVPAVHWHPIDSRVEMVYVPEPTASYVPDGDAVFAGFWATAEYVMDYPPEKGRKFYLWQGYEEEWAGRTARVLAALRAPLKKVAVSRALYEHAFELGVPGDEMAYIPDGMDHKTYRVLHPIEDRAARISMLYHPLPQKGADDGIRALNLARRRFQDLKAVIFGVSPRPKGLPDWIEYRCDPPQEEIVASIYNGSSIYLCPSWAEGFGLPPAEAMACGCAVAAADSGGIRDFAEHGVTALLSPPKRPEALAENLLRLLKDDDLRIRLAKAGHERIQEFTWERSANLLEQFIAERIGWPA